MLLKYNLYYISHHRILLFIKILPENSMFQILQLQSTYLCHSQLFTPSPTFSLALWNFNRKLHQKIIVNEPGGQTLLGCCLKNGILIKLCCTTGISIFSRPVI